MYFRIIFFSLITSFYVFEIFLNYFEFDDLKKKIIYKYKFGKKYDARSKVEVYQDLKKKEIEVSFYLTLNDYIDGRINKDYLLPLAGQAYKNTVMCNESGNYSTYMSDRYGFNNPDYEWDKEKIDFFISWRFICSWCMC